MKGEPTNFSGKSIKTGNPVGVSNSECVFPNLKKNLKTDTPCDIIEDHDWTGIPRFTGFVMYPLIFRFKPMV